MHEGTDDGMMPGDDGPKDAFLRMCVRGSPWLHWAYWFNGGKVGTPKGPDLAKEPTVAMLSELLLDGEIVAGEPRGWFGFDAWDLDAEASVARIRREWDALRGTPNHADIAAFTATEAGRARYRREHPRTQEEIERLRLDADDGMRRLFDELGDLPELAAEWGEMHECEREQVEHDWHTFSVLNGLVPLEWKRREGLLTAEQEARYQALKESLREALPDLRRLGLDVPDEILRG